MEDLRLYVLMRNDLQSMSAGRACAQANHAASVFEHRFGDRPRVKQWKKQTKDGFGTCIVLTASLEQIEAILKKIDTTPIKGWVVDPDYVIRVSREVAGLMHQNYDAKHCNFKFNYDFADENTVPVSREEKTCAFVFGEKEEMALYLGDLPLY